MDEKERLETLRLMAKRDDLVLGTIAALHAKSVTAAGMTDGYCAECENVWPCRTAHLANGWGNGEECHESGWCAHAGVCVR